MYIIFESIASNDPRADDRIKEVGRFWNYTIARIDDSDVRYDWLHGLEIPENQALANKFGGSVDGEITVLNANFKNYDEIVSPSSGGDQSYKKEIYFLNEQDKANARDFLKSVMKLHIKNHIKEGDIGNPPGTAMKLNSMIDQIQTLNDAQVFLKDYFEMDCSAYTAGKKPKPLFKVNW